MKCKTKNIKGKKNIILISHTDYPLTDIQIYQLSQVSAVNFTYVKVFLLNFNLKINLHDVEQSMKFHRTKF